MAFVLVAGAATVALLAWLPLHPLAQIAAIAWAGAMCLSALRKLRCTKEVVLDVSNLSGLNGTFVTPWLTVIRTRPSALILPDMLSREDFRKLRVLLRHAKPGTDPSFRRQER